MNCILDVTGRLLSFLFFYSTWRKPLRDGWSFELVFSAPPPPTYLMASSIDRSVLPQLKYLSYIHPLGREG